jgi:transposase-like protein
MALPAIYSDDNAAREHLETLLWPEGPVCPHCGNSAPDRITKLAGKSTRPGVYKCKECRKPFSVTVGTVFERSHIPLHQWVYAVHLYTSSKKGFSAHQLHRTLKVTYKTAWFMSHRIREAMKDTGPVEAMGGSGAIVEADETYFGQLETPRVSKQRQGRPYKNKRGPGSKRAVVGLVERGGKARMFHVDNATKADVARVVRTHVSRESTLHTDESKLYVKLGTEFSAHHTVCHSANEYVRGEVHTNTIEGVFSIFKRGMKGVYQHCGEAHLHRYLAEFDFRYNHRIKLGFNDDDRAVEAIKGAAGKRLTYRVPDSTADA